VLMNINNLEGAILKAIFRIFAGVAINEY